jgi:hypothetical protein
MPCHGVTLRRRRRRVYSYSESYSSSIVDAVKPGEIEWDVVAQEKSPSR